MHIVLQLNVLHRKLTSQRSRCCLLSLLFEINAAKVVILTCFLFLTYHKSCKATVGSEENSFLLVRETIKNVVYSISELRHNQFSKEKVATSYALYI